MRRAMLTLALVLAGCGDSTGPSRNVTGIWVGDMSGVVTTINVEQHGIGISGTGTINGPGGSQSMSVAGTFRFPRMSVILTSPGFPQFTFDGVLSGDTINGVLNGPGISNVGYTLTRE